MIDETTIITFDSRESAHAPSYTLSWGFTKYHKNINYGLSIESKDKFYFSDSHNEESQAYSIANIHFDYQLNSNAEISLWSKNIFNKKYATRGFYFINEPPWDTNKLYLSYGEPFTIGITLKYNY